MASAFIDIKEPGYTSFCWINLVTIIIILLLLTYCVPLTEFVYSTIMLFTNDICYVLAMPFSSIFLLHIYKNISLASLEATMCRHESNELCLKLSGGIIQRLFFHPWKPL